MAEKIPATRGGMLSADFILAKAGVNEGMKVADLGCGAIGYFVLPAAKMVGQRGIVYGVDIQKSALDGVKSKARMEGVNNIELVWSDLEVYGATKIPASSLDVALIITTLHQAKKRGEMMQEAMRLLKIGGILEIVDWKKISTPFGPDISLRLDQEEVKKLAQSLGFKLVEEFEAGQYHFGLKFKREV